MGNDVIGCSEDIKQLRKGGYIVWVCVDIMRNNWKPHWFATYIEAREYILDGGGGGYPIVCCQTI